MQNTKITDTIQYVGTDDKNIDLFESQYIVPNGVSYNSYVILDEKTAVMDGVDERAEKEWFENLEHTLNGKQPDYLVVTHLEPDHAGNIQKFMEKYPQAQIVVNAKALSMLPQFFTLDMSARSVVVKEGDELTLGNHVLTFIMAPMVHWPEVMMAYEKTEKVLFSADAFGKFGALSTEEDWACEARRYYFNIVGKYGMQVQALLKKASALDIRMICPLHGPVLSENLDFYLEKYQTWSSYEPEDKGVLIAYASIHGNTGKAAEKLAALLREKGVKKSWSWICRERISRKPSKMLSGTTAWCLRQLLMMLAFSPAWTALLHVSNLRITRSAPSASWKTEAGRRWQERL